MNAVIVGTGGYLPEKILTNSDIEKMVDTTDEWITTRTGIKQRHIASENEFTSDMATNAAKDALTNSNLNASDIDLIVVATTTPDKTFPSTAVQVQANIGAFNGAAFDIQAVCSGFVYALSIANNFIKTGQAKNVLIIGAEKMSAIIDWSDRNTCILFGDGAGAVILQAKNDSSNGIIDCQLHSDGRQIDILQTTGGTTTTKEAGTITMRGKEVFKHASEKMASCAKSLILKNKLSLTDIDFVIPHQANVRIMEMVAKKLDLSIEKVVSSVTHHANTSAASIPLALHEKHRKTPFKQDDLIVLTALGGGITWGSALLKW